MFEKAAWYNDLPDERLALCPENLKLFFQTMYERQLIWFRRFVLEKERPWTDDEIFQTSKFTNVYRELDRNSQWLIKNVILDDKIDTATDLVWRMMLYRFHNEPATFELASGVRTAMFVDPKPWRNGIPSYEEYNEDEWAEHITSVRASGQNPYTTAYLINSQAAPGKSRDYCYTRLVAPTLHKKVPEIVVKIKTLKDPNDFIKYLTTLPAVADFIAHEFYQDFTYITRYNARFEKFFQWDQDDYTNVGPGCSIGIRLIYPNLKTVREQKSAIYWLRDMAGEQLRKVEQNDESFPFLDWDKPDGYYHCTDECNITLHQIEMWLCEFQKYWKMMIGKGKQRSQFNPTSKTLISK